MICGFHACISILKSSCVEILQFVPLFPILQKELEIMLPFSVTWKSKIEWDADADDFMPNVWTSDLIYIIPGTL